MKLTISKIPVKFQKYIPDLKTLCNEFIDILRINHKNLKAINIDKEEVLIWYKLKNAFLYQYQTQEYKDFFKKELESVVKASIMTDPFKKICKWGFPVWAVTKSKNQWIKNG